jgi:hypothetical protein
MKKIALLCICISLSMLSCDKNEEVASILPARFSVTIPGSLSQGDISHARMDANSLDGNLVYANLRVFIKVGEISAQTIENIIQGIRRYGIDKPMEIKLRSHWDDRFKYIKVEEAVHAEGRVWDYGLNAWDSQDSILAFQLYWNRYPVEGIAIMKVYEMNRLVGEFFKDWMYKVEYSEADATFEKKMNVSITRPVNQMEHKWAINKLKMFAGKKGDDVHVSGNTFHPNLWLVDQDFPGGRNYAFIGKGNLKHDIGVAIISLPPSSVTTNVGLPDVYSIYNVVKSEIESAFDVIIEPGGFLEQLYQSYLSNTQAPGYFMKSVGFVSCGISIPKNIGFTPSFIDLSGLKPFAPAVVRDLDIKFN